MPDLQAFNVTRTGTATLTVPVWSISGEIRNSRTGALMQDFTGANAVNFPQVLGTLTNAQQDDFVSRVVLDLLAKRFPSMFT